MLKVLLPTSGLGSRIGDLTEHTNKALVRVGTKPTLSHIIESYPDDTEFVVMLGHKGELVKEFLSLAYPTRVITYMDIEMKRGNMGLLPALLAERDKLTGPFIFHACDTITLPLPTEFIESDENIILGYPIKGDVSQYRLVRHTEGEVERIMDKGEMHAPQDLIHIGVVKFHDMHEFWPTVQALVDADPTNKGTGDTHIIERMIRDFDSAFTVLPAATWYDTGNVTCLEETRKAFGTDGAKLLEKVDQGIYLWPDRVIKFFADDNEVECRYLRAQFLGDAVPLILGRTEHFLMYKKAPGTIGTEMSYPQMTQFLSWCQSKLWSRRPQAFNRSQFKENCLQFYHIKTLYRLADFYAKTGIVDRGVIINGLLCPPVGELLLKVDWEQLSDGTPTACFHGDLHPSNILIQDLDFILLDWRNKFGDDVEKGDVYYDLAKINHGLIVSHDLVDQELFTVDIKGHVQINLDILRKHKLVECQTAFFKWCLAHGYNTWKINTLTALIFLNIAALHHRPYDKFLYYLGQIMLTECLNAVEDPDTW